jgi:phenylpropionate dioxygenase-like ring-hydroxylating dioxygenase large terminal subunit
MLDSITPKNETIDPSWARALHDPAAFAHEQAQLGQVWTLLGLTVDIPNDGDWLRATLGGRSVFVQRFGDTLRGFENRCAHRFYPLRTEDKGNGVIRCGFHHWQYDKDGRAVGIPKCQEMFGVTPRELGARLNAIEVATCGILVFGRFPAPDATETLEQFLGDGFTILQSMFGQPTPYSYIERPVAANWKLCFHITLEEYHIVAVHPESFGKEGYLSPETVHYSRFGSHSAFFESDSVEIMAAQCRDGSYRPKDYRVLHFFPYMVAAHINAAGIWYVVLQQYLPVSHDRTLMRGWSFQSPFPAEEHNWIDRWKRQIIAPWVPLGMKYYWSRTLAEDHGTCEKMQTIVSQVEGSPLLAKQEQRIVWFEQAYAKAMAATPIPAAVQASEIFQTVPSQLKLAASGTD